MTLTAMRPVLGLSKGREVSLWMCGTDVFSHMKATYRGSTTSPTAQASHGDTKTRRKVLGRNADALVGISTPEQDKYGNSETRLKNFGGCRSWLDLPGLEGVELAPVISDEEPVARRDALQTCWADLANDFYDCKMPTIPFETIVSRSELSFRGAQALALKVFSNSLTASMISSKSGTSPKNMGPSMAW